MRETHLLILEHGLNGEVTAGSLSGVGGASSHHCLPSSSTLIAQTGAGLGALAGLPLQLVQPLAHTSSSKHMSSSPSHPTMVPPVGKALAYTYSRHSTRAAPKQGTLGTPGLCPFQLKTSQQAGPRAECPGTPGLHLFQHQPAS